MNIAKSRVRAFFIPTEIAVDYTSRTGRLKLGVLSQAVNRDLGELAVPIQEAEGTPGYLVLVGDDSFEEAAEDSLPLWNIEIAEDGTLSWTSEVLPGDDGNWWL